MPKPFEQCLFGISPGSAHEKWAKGTVNGQDNPGEHKKQPLTRRCCALQAETMRKKRKGGVCLPFCYGMIHLAECSQNSFAVSVFVEACVYARIPFDYGQFQILLCALRLSGFAYSGFTDKSGWLGRTAELKLASLLVPLRYSGHREYSREGVTGPASAQLPENLNFETFALPPVTDV